MLTGNISVKGATPTTTARKKKQPTSTTVQPDPVAQPVNAPTGGGPNVGNLETNFDANGNPTSVTEVAPTPNATNTVDPNPPGGTQGTGGNGPDGSQNDPSEEAFQPPPPSTNQMIEDFSNRYLGATADTTADEAAMRAEMENQLGGNLYNQRAALGAAGFGASGMGVALENDARAQAARDIASGMVGIRRGAAQDVYERGLGAAGLDIQEREAASREANDKARWAVIEHLLGGGDPGAVVDPAAGSPSGGISTTGQGRGGADVNLLDPTTHVTTDSSTLATAGDADPTAATQDPNSPDLPREQAARHSDDPPVKTVTGANGYTVYQDRQTGEYYRVDGG